MSNSFDDFFKNISLISGLTIMVYTPADKLLFRYGGGSVKPVPIPQILESSLSDGEKIISFYSKNGDSVVIYFFRIVSCGVSYVCVIKDTKDRKNLNKFFQAYSEYCQKLEGEMCKLNQQVEEFGSIIAGGVTNELTPAPADDLVSVVEIPESAVDGGGQIFTEKILSLEGAIAIKDSEIEELKKLIDHKSSKISEFDAKLAEARFDLKESQSLIEILRKSRDKMKILIDGVMAPLYSISRERLLLHANRATAQFAGVDNVASLVGKKCHEVLFGKVQPCEWCKLEQVMDTGESSCVEVKVEKAGKIRVIDSYSFPVVDTSGVIVDCGGVIVDKTDTIEMESSMSKIREQLKTFKKSKISDMNELQEIKKAYSDLSINYTALLGRNVKMTKTLETLMGKDSTKEMLAVKTEIQEYKNKLARAYDAIKNYQRNVENLQTKYTELNKRTFFQMERLINVMNSKYGGTEEDVRSALEVLARNIEDIKRANAAKESESRENEKQPAV